MGLNSTPPSSPAPRRTSRSCAPLAVAVALLRRELLSAPVASIHGWPSMVLHSYLLLHEALWSLSLASYAPIHQSDMRNQAQTAVGLAVTLGVTVVLHTMVVWAQTLHLEAIGGYASFARSAWLARNEPPGGEDSHHYRGTPSPDMSPALAGGLSPTFSGSDSATAEAEARRSRAFAALTGTATTEPPSAEYHSILHESPRWFSGGRPSLAVGGATPPAAASAVERHRTAESACSWLWARSCVTRISSLHLAAACGAGDPYALEVRALRMAPSDDVDGAWGLAWRSMLLLRPTSRQMLSCHGLLYSLLVLACTVWFLVWLVGTAVFIVIAPHPFGVWPGARG